MQSTVGLVRKITLFLFKSYLFSLFDIAIHKNPIVNMIMEFFIDSSFKIFNTITSTTTAIPISFRTA